MCELRSSFFSCREFYSVKHFSSPKQKYNSVHKHSKTQAKFFLQCTSTVVPAARLASAPESAPRGAARGRPEADSACSVWLRLQALPDGRTRAALLCLSGQC